MASADFLSNPQPCSITLNGVGSVINALDYKSVGWRLTPEHC